MVRHNVHPDHPTAPPRPRALTDAVARLEAMRNSRVLLLADGPRRQIDACTYADVRKALHKLHIPHLDVFIQSGGGLPHEAYKLARLFSGHSSVWSVLIGEHAKSAATLIALGASEIVMSRDAELGPIDVLLVPAGGNFTIGPAEAVRILKEALRPTWTTSGSLPRSWAG